MFFQNDIIFRFLAFKCIHCSAQSQYKKPPTRISMLKYFVLYLYIKFCNRGHFLLDPKQNAISLVQPNAH